MKGFKFKLEALLKMRTFKEEEWKREIGLAQNKLQQVVNQLNEHSSSIDEAYESQSVSLKRGLTGDELKFYDFFITGHRAKIKLLTNEKIAMEKKIAEMFQTLAQLRADVKVLESMKEKHQMQYKRDIDKKKIIQLEEEVMQWLQRSKN